MTFAQVHLGKDGRLGFARLGGFRNLHQKGVATDFEGRRVEALGLGLPPMPHGVHHTESGAAETFAPADAPVVFRGGGKALESGDDLGPALLLQPLESPEFLELALEDVAQGGQVPDIERRVIEQFRGDGAPGSWPSGHPVERDAEMLLQGKRDRSAAGSNWAASMVSKRLRLEATTSQQAQVEIAAVHDQMFFPAPSRAGRASSPGETSTDDIAPDQELEGQTSCSDTCWPVRCPRRPRRPAQGR